MHSCRTLRSALRSATFGMKVKESHPFRNFWVSRKSFTEDEYAPNYYAVLDIPKSASIKEIKLAYFRKAKIYHPDANSSHEAKFMFRLVSEAYSILSSWDKRQMYDQFGTVGRSQGGTTTSGPQRAANEDNETSEELFSRIFGAASGDILSSEFEGLENFNDCSYHGHAASREQVVTVSFEEAVFGCTVGILQNMKIVCPKCGGQKSELGYQSNICSYCEGSGMESERIGETVRRKTCSYCEGTKLFNKFKCLECVGTGLVVWQMEMNVHIPPGCENGQVLKVPIDEKLMKGTIAHHDHIFVRVNVQGSSSFRKDGHDVISQEDVSISQAILGGHLVCRGLDGSSLSLKLDGAKSSHCLLVAPHRGIPKTSGCSRGHHFVEIGISPPKKMTADARRLFIEIFNDEVLEMGLVDGCDEPEYAHKLKTCVVEPTKIERKFK